MPACISEVVGQRKRHNLFTPLSQMRQVISLRSARRASIVSAIGRRLGRVSEGVKEMLIFCGGPIDVVFGVEVEAVASLRVPTRF